MGARALASAGVETGGAAHNRRFVEPALTIAAGVRSEDVTLAHDPQTSGGLLAAITADRLDAVEAALDARQVECRRVGRVEAGEPGVALARRVAVELAPGIRRLGTGVANVYLIEEAGAITIVDAGMSGYWRRSRRRSCRRRTGPSRMSAR